MRSIGFSNVGMSYSPSMKGKVLSPKDCSKIITNVKVLTDGKYTIPHSKSTKNQVLNFIDQKLKALVQNPDAKYSYMFDILEPLHFVKLLARDGHKRAAQMLRKFQKAPNYFNIDIRQASSDFSTQLHRANLHKRLDKLQTPVITKKISSK